MYMYEGMVGTNGLIMWLRNETSLLQPLTVSMPGLVKLLCMAMHQIATCTSVGLLPPEPYFSNNAVM